MFSSKSSSIAFAFFLASVIASSQQAWACAVCGAGNNDRIEKTLLFSTAVLSFVPLLLIGGIGYYIYRRFQGDNKG
jgi:zinc transporter ZupT